MQQRPRTYAQGIRRGPRPAARAHQPDGRLRRACDRRSDALPRRARHRRRRAGRRGRQEARRARSRDRTARRSADRPCARRWPATCATSSPRSRSPASSSASAIMRRTSPSVSRCSRTSARSSRYRCSPEMARIATEMVHDVLDAFVERDAEAAVRGLRSATHAVDDFYEFDLPHPADAHDGKSRRTSASPRICCSLPRTSSGSATMRPTSPRWSIMQRPASTWPTAPKVGG